VLDYFNAKVSEEFVQSIQGDVGLGEFEIPVRKYGYSLRIRLSGFVAITRVYLDRSKVAFEMKHSH
jgi:hypothetical protein